MFILHFLCHSVVYQSKYCWIDSFKTFSFFSEGLIHILRHKERFYSLGLQKAILLCCLSSSMKICDLQCHRIYIKNRKLTFGNADDHYSRGKQIFHEESKEEVYYQRNERSWQNHGEWVCVKKEYFFVRVYMYIIIYKGRFVIHQIALARGCLNINVSQKGIL